MLHPFEIWNWKPWNLVWKDSAEEDSSDSNFLPLQLFKNEFPKILYADFDAAVTAIVK